MAQKPVFMEGLFTLRNLRSMGAAALIEILIAMGVAGVLVWQRLQPPPVTPLPPVQPVIPDTPAPPQPHPQAPVPDHPKLPHLSQVPPVNSDIPGPNVPPLQPLQPPFVPPQTGPAVDPARQFETAMLRAIDAAKVYPKAEMLKGNGGEAVVSFDYAGGVVSNIRVDRSTGSRDLDRAAIDAVQKAALPAKPEGLAGLTHFTFTLVFDLGG